MQEWVQTKGLVNKSQLEGFPQVEDNDLTVAQPREALKPRGYYGDYRYKPMEGAPKALHKSQLHIERLHNNQRGQYNNQRVPHDNQRVQHNN